MRRVVLALVSTVTGLVLLLGFKSHSPVRIATPVAAAPVTPGGTATTPAPTPSASSSAAAGTGSTAAKTVDGDAVDTRWGPVQVRITLSGTKITSIELLQVPANNQRDIEINNVAVPTLTQETISAQSAQIDSVSGATYTSEGYIPSLQSALDKAGR